MPRDQTNSKPAIHPRFCWDESPTYSTWVKLSAADVHALTQEPPYKGQDVYFYLNHPIRYVKLVGVITEVFTRGSARRVCVITLDDGSGQSIGVTLDIEQQAQDPPSLAQMGPEARNVRKDREPVDPSSVISSASQIIVSEMTGKLTVSLHGKALDIGTVVLVKGAVTTFKAIHQIALKRIKLVMTSTGEMQAWKELSNFKQAVLCKPWILSADQISALQARDHKNRLQQHRRDEARRAHLARKAGREARRSARAAVERKREEDFFDEGALPGSDTIARPW